jgi:DNA-binding response OmpR family regulator
MKRILAVDDEPMVLDVIKTRLEFAGYEVITAADGLEGLKRVRAGHPDLIVLDLILPGLNGYQICRMLKGDDRYRGIPILMLTARSQEKDVAEGMRAGADAYMAKPYETDEFVAKVKSLLEASDQQREDRLAADRHTAERKVAYEQSQRFPAQAGEDPSAKRPK